MWYNWLGANFAPSIITYSLSFIVLLTGSITDLKTREVPDWVNYGLIISGVGLNLLFTAVYSNPSFIINSIIGLAVFFGIAYLMFEMGQWGGGDSKMLMGLGAIIGLDVSALPKQFLLGFFINAMFAGAVYGLLWSIFLAFRNRKKFKKEFRSVLSSKNTVFSKKLIIAAVILLAVLAFFIEAKFRILFLLMMLLIIITFYLSVSIKAIEKSSMYKLVGPAKLTEGDWIVNDIFVNGKYITGPKELGISKSQIRKLITFYKKRKIKKILIKEGIPFVPSFLIAFVMTFLIGNPLMWLL